MLRTILAICISLMLQTCAPSEPVRVHYDADAGTSFYTSSRILLGYRDMSSGLAGGQRVMWQALASCSGHACTPDEVALAFYNDSDSDLNLDYRRLRIVFDGTTRDWEDLSRINEPEVYAVPRGEFLRIPISFADFLNIASAEDVAVLFGETVSFSSAFENRATFRALAEQTGGGTSAR